jgi:PAS domain-containing protein
MYKRPISSFFQPVKKQATGKKSRANATSGIGDAATHDSARADSSLSSGKNQYTVFCDLDGVLVDFDAGVRRLLGKSPDQVPSKRLWPAIHGAPHFYRDLPWMEDGEELWEALRRTPFPLNILTGVSARGGIVQDKYLWCQRELCVETALVDMTGLAGNKRHEPAQSNVRRKHGVVNVITCWSKNKHCESKRGQYVFG